jgi:hypothetical protein
MEVVMRSNLKVSKINLSEVNRNCGRSSVVEFQPSKLAVAGSNPVARSIMLKGGLSLSDFLRLMSSRVSKGSAHVAQLVEHVLGKDEVTRSIRVVGSSNNRI